MVLLLRWINEVPLKLFEGREIWVDEPAKAFISRTGKYVCYIDGDVVYVWDANSGSLLASKKLDFKPSRDRIDCGNDILVLAKKNDILLFSLPSIVEILRISRAHNKICSVGFTYDMKRIVSVGKDGVKVWSLDGALIRETDRVKCRAVAYDPEAELMAFREKDSIIVYDLRREIDVESEKTYFIFHESIVKDEALMFIHKHRLLICLDTVLDSGFECDVLDVYCLEPITPLARIILPSMLSTIRYFPDKETVIITNTHNINYILKLPSLELGFIRITDDAIPESFPAAFDATIIGDKIRIVGSTKEKSGDRLFVLDYRFQ